MRLIVTADQAAAIGFEGRLLHRFQEDLNNFKDRTHHETVVMGSNTYKLIGGPLENRRNIVISSSTLETVPKVEIVRSLREAYRLAPNAFIIGGESVFREALNNDYVDEVYITVMEMTFPNADAFFPSVLDRDDWEIEELDRTTGRYKGEDISLAFFRLTRGSAGGETEIGDEEDDEDEDPD